MKDLSEKNFGVVIAFLLPGFILLWGISFSSRTVADWLAKANSTSAPTFGGFLYASLASLALGLVVSAVRWAIIDQLLRLFGTRAPKLNFESLSDKDKYAAFTGAVENHYRYYQYYANTLVALVASFAIYVIHGPNPPTWPYWIVAGALILILFLGSRDSLTKYFERIAAILGTLPETGER
jgi:hypothetical protein